MLYPYVVKYIFVIVHRIPCQYEARIYVFIYLLVALILIARRASHLCWKFFMLSFDATIIMISVLIDILFIEHSLHGTETNNESETNNEPYSMRDKRKRLVISFSLGNSHVKILLKKTSIANTLPGPNRARNGYIIRSQNLNHKVVSARNNHQEKLLLTSKKILFSCIAAMRIPKHFEPPCPKISS